MIEVFFVVLLVGLLISLLLPAVTAARETARRASCANHFIQIAMATHGYHNAFEQFPVQLSGTDGSVIPGNDNDMRLSALVGLLPFLDRQVLAEQIQSPLDSSFNSPMGYWLGGQMADEQAGATSQKPDVWVAGGPSPIESSYGPWFSEVSLLRCPSDPGIGGFGRTNYAMCIGDAMIAGNTGPMKDVNGKFKIDDTLAKQTLASMRGIFVPRQVTRFSDVTDGLSNTIMMGEIVTDLGDNDTRSHPAGASAMKLRDNPNLAQTEQLYDVTRPRYWDSRALPPKITLIPSARRGLRWSDGMPLYTSVTTILPPNRELVISADSDDAWCQAPPSSQHLGGAHVVFGDAMLRFVSDTVDAGLASQPSVYVGSRNEPGSESVYGVWGAMGSRASGELSVNQWEVSILAD